MKELDFLAAFNRPLTIQAKSDNPFKDAKRPAAVLICLFSLNNELQVLFTERATHLKHHAGQISFPGGKAEKFDTSLVDTAYRETQEEIGIERQHLQLLGRLSEYKTISGFAVTPVIAQYQKPLDVLQDLIIDANEVASVFHVPLAHLMNKQHYYIEMIQRGNQRFPVYFIPYKNRMIWGATAGMLAQLQEHIEGKLF